MIKYPQKNPTTLLELPDTFIYFANARSVEKPIENVKGLKLSVKYTGKPNNERVPLKPEFFPNLMTISVPTQNAYFLAEEGVLYNSDKTILYWYPPKKPSFSFTIPNSVKTLALDAFSNVENLQNLNLTANIETINKNFEGCKITSINNIKTRKEYINWNPSIKSVFQKYLHFFEDTPFSISLVEQEVQYAVDTYIKKGMNDYEKINALYNYVVKKVSYTEGNVNDGQYHCISSVFLGDETVCEGYAFAMSLLLDKIGIPNCCVAGGNHAWNLVKISDVWLQIDATWDDEGDYAGQSNFLKSKSEYDKKYHPAYKDNGKKDFTKYSFGVDKSIYNNNLPECNISIGDINKDGVIDNKDLNHIMNEIQGYAKYSNLGYYNVIADVKLDGKIDMDDYYWLSDKIALQQKGILIGDLNQNGIHDEEDLSLLENEIKKFNSQPGYYNVFADVKYDRVLDTNDYKLLEAYVYYTI